MDLELSEDQELLRQTTGRFLARTCPLDEVRRLAGQAPLGFERDWWRKGAELGWTSMLVPEELGGGSLSGEGVLDLVTIAEEMGRAVAPGPLVPVNLVAGALADSGTPTQRAEVLPGLVSGASLAAWCVAEPGGSWDGAGVRLAARPSGTDFILSGVKAPVEAALDAEHLLVVARTGEGVTEFLVRSDTPGVTVVAMESLDLVRRFARVEFDEVPVGAGQVIGAVAMADAAVERRLQLAAVMGCAETSGALQRVFDFTLEYAFDRHSFGRPLASYQALKHRFADLKLWVEACAGATTGAARALQNSDGNAAEMVSAAKSYIGNHAHEVIQDCVQLHGGIGVTWDHDLHLFLRRVTVNGVSHGTPNAHRELLASLIGL